MLRREKPKAKPQSAVKKPAKQNAKPKAAKIAKRPRAAAEKTNVPAIERSTPGTAASKAATTPKKKIPLGRTLKTKDKYLPHDLNKVKELKDRRWVVVIDKNTNEELAVIRLTDEHQPNTTKLPTYKKGNKRNTYFKHFVEIEDSEGNAIHVDGKKFLENAAEYDLSREELKLLRDKVLNHSKQSQSNRNKILILKNKKPRD